MAVAVVDASGHLVASGRMDGANFLTMEIALAKARAAALLGQPTSATAERAPAARQLYDTLAALSGGPMVHVAGGLPVLLAGAAIGGLGVSGGLPDEDQRVAEAALAVAWRPE